MLKKLLGKIQQFRYSKRIQKEFKTDYNEFLKNPLRKKNSSSWLLMRQAAFASRGKTQQWAWDIQKNLAPYVESPCYSDFFPRLNEAVAEDAVSKLKEDGFYIMPWLMPKNWVDSVVEDLKKLQVESREDKKDLQIAKTVKPVSATYWHSDKDLVKIKELRSLILDKGVLEIISRYLGCKAVFDLTAAWWSFPSGKPSSASAQLFHYDCDRIRWLKVFVYLNDVGVSNGPHSFIRKSHKDSLIKCLRDERHSDEEIFKIYDKSAEVQFIGPAGTVILEDTMGFHKGNPVTNGHRLIFEYEYSINHYGWAYDELGV